MRTKKSILNFISSYTFFIAIAILGFVKIKFFIVYLGEDVLALNQLYLNVFSYINIVEAGLGISLVYRLYKLLINKEYEKINALISGIQYILKRIGFIILGIGFLFSFIIPFLIKDNLFDGIYLNITFMLFVVKNIIDYFMFAPRYIIQADQRMYKINILIYAFRIIETAAEIIIIISGLNYIIVLLPSLLSGFIRNIIVNRKIQKLYPWFKRNTKKDLSVKNDVKPLLIHRITRLFFSNIDIVLLSAFIGATAVAVYAVYNYVVQYARGTVASLFNSIKDGLGHVINSESTDKIRDVIDEINTIFSFISVLIVVVLYFVLNPFVSIWMGNNFLVDPNTLILFLAVIYIGLILRAGEMLRTTTGAFKETQAMAIAEAALNLMLSLALVHFYGIKGVLFATVFASVATNLWYLPYIVYKKLFGFFRVSDLFYHIKNMAIITLLILCFEPITKLISKVVPIISFWSWLLYSAIIGVVILVMVILLFLIIYKPFKTIIAKVILNIRSLKKQLYDKKTH